MSLPICHFRFSIFVLETLKFEWQFSQYLELNPSCVLLSPMIKFFVKCRAIINKQECNRMRTAHFSGHWGAGFCPGVFIQRGLCPEWRPLPPVDRMTDTPCENITLPQTSFAGGNKAMQSQNRNATTCHNN